MYVHVPSYTCIKNVHEHVQYMYRGLYCTCVICWQLLRNQNVKGPYLEAEVVEEVMGWLG